MLSSGLARACVIGLAMVLAGACRSTEREGDVEGTAAEREAAGERMDAGGESRPGDEAAETGAPESAPSSKEAEVNDPELTTTPSGLKYKDLAPGTGDEARKGKVAVVHYTGWLVDGTKFDSSLDRGQPFEFPIGGGRVIKGWDEGVARMKGGGKRRLVIPPELGYGASGAGAVIPPDATLIFEVELLQVR